MAIYLGFKAISKIIFAAFFVGLFAQILFVDDWKLGRVSCMNSGLPCLSKDESYPFIASVRVPSTIDLSTQTTTATTALATTTKRTEKTINIATTNLPDAKTNFDEEKFLLIGIPSVSRRENTSYLTKTLEGLLNELNPQEKRQIRIVVFLADIIEPSNNTFNNWKEIRANFTSNDYNGVVQFIEAPLSFYPRNFDRPDALWGHTKARSAWLNKQSLDYVYLWKYCMKLEYPYYLHLEDDVLPRKGYFKSIKKFIAKYRNNKWSSLEFGDHGTVGTLYRRTDLNKLQTFTNIFSWFYPVDILVKQFNEFHLHGNPEWSRHKPPIFSHVGEVSSFQGQISTGELNNHNRTLLVNHIFASAQFPKAEVIEPMRRKPKMDAFLIIGIPTVKRKKESYLIETVEKLVTELTKENNKRDVLIVIFLSDIESERIHSVTNDIASNFPKEIKSGLIKVIKAPLSYYENRTFDGLPVLWKDKPERIKWRAKQCLDYAFLFNYIYTNYPGKYYLHMEDDIRSTNDYLAKIKHFIKVNKKHKWSILEFAKSLGFIGFLYRSSDLGRLARFVRTYYWSLPVDMLARHYHEFHLFGNPKWAVHHPPVFEHIGFFSSLEGVTRKPSSKIPTRTYMTCDNPPANITTSIKPAMPKDYRDIASTYAKKAGTFNYFWGLNVTIGDYILLQFAKPENISKLVVNSAGKLSALDYFGGAKISRSEDCDMFVPWKSFKEERHLIITEKHGMLCSCIQIEVSSLRKDAKNKTRWVLIEEIAIWTFKSTHRSTG